MNSFKLTDAEARRLLDMTKKSLVKEITFPAYGNKQEFDVEGDGKSDLFSINIYRGKIQPKKYNIGARIKKNSILLLELHINPTNVHVNPDGNKIYGNHWHIYSEKYGRRYAFPAEDIQDDLFVENTIKFLKRFNVIEEPQIYYQLEIL